MGESKGLKWVFKVCIGISYIRFGLRGRFEPDFRKWLFIHNLGYFYNIYPTSYNRVQRRMIRRSSRSSAMALAMYSGRPMRILVSDARVYIVYISFRFRRIVCRANGCVGLCQESHNLLRIHIILVHILQITGPGSTRGGESLSSLPDEPG